MMSDTITPLTTDEQTILMLAAAGEFLMAIGRWEQPIIDLVRRGYLTDVKFNHEITEAGQEALKAWEADEDRFLGKAIDKVKGIVEQAPIGPTVVDGILFFRMTDGSTIQSGIGEPYASQVLEMWRGR